MTDMRFSPLVVMGLLLGLGMLVEAQSEKAEPELKGTAPLAEGGKPTESKRLSGTLVYGVKDKAHGKVGYEDAEEALAQQLGKIYKEYAHFQMLGEHSEDLFKDTFSWVAPSEIVCVKFDSKGHSKDGGIKLDLQLWSQGKAIIKADAILKADSPVFIEGPDWGKGRLFFMLKLEDKKSEKRNGQGGPGQQVQ